MCIRDRMTSVLQNHFAGAIGWDAVNMYFAPYTVGWDYDKYLQLVQQLIFEFNQLAGGKLTNKYKVAPTTITVSSLNLDGNHFTDATLPVSYTHLDVYKRQIKYYG